MPFCYEAHVFRKTKNVLRFTTKVAQSAYLKSFAVVTQKLAELYREIGVPEDKTLVLPDGVDLKKFDIAISKQEARERLKLPKDKKIIGYIGRFQTFEQEKGISEMIEAMKYLKNSLRENTLMVFVGGPMEVVPKYLSVIQKHGLALDDFRFVDRVAPTQIPLFLKAFDICAMPFPWSEHYAYAMSPLKMFEYMASSRPVVATNLPSVTEILQNGRNAIIVEPDGSEALAIGIEQVMEDEELAKRIANQAYQDVKQYSWIVRAQRVLDFVTGRREIYAL
jgi:glycosyltransferase involved in cell wall biosynthesis